MFARVLALKALFSEKNVLNNFFLLPEHFLWKAMYGENLSKSSNLLVRSKEI